MCGIAGIFHTRREPVARYAVTRMCQKLAHRGPDGEGAYVEDNVALGHKRLAILDTSPLGSQPMSSKNGEWHVTFNGCIYNFLELQQELKAAGHHFVSGSDTEVLVESLAAYGVAAISRFNGMFAVGAWHKPTRTLYLFRDRFGVKPLYYWFRNGLFLFASEVKAILAHPRVSTQLNPEALNEYFTFQNLFSDNTLFDGVRLLPAGAYLRLDEQTEQLRPEIWWDYDFTQPDESMTFEDAQSETERLMRRAVARQMISDVPVGSYLSGGMDSGSITALASGHLPRLTTFTCGFDMSEVTGVEANYDERRDAELVANAFRTEHYEQIMNAGDLSWSLPRVVYHLEDLRVGMCYPNYYISRLASKFVKVCLQGTGGDELFCGYPWRYYRVFRSLNQSEYFDQYYSFWQRLVPDQDRRQLFTEEIDRNIDVARPRRVFEEVFQPHFLYETPEQHIQNSLYFEIKTFLHGLLMVGDKLSMAHGLEERFPFLDNDLVDFAQKIPVRHKLGNLEKRLKIDENEFRSKRKLYEDFDDGKNVLRKAMQNIIPERIVNRKKQGFSAPDESWYRGENALYVKTLLLGHRSISSQFINHDYVEQIIDQHINQRQNFRLLIWSFMNFELWCRIFLNHEDVESFC